MNGRLPVEKNTTFKFPFVPAGTAQVAAYLEQPGKATVAQAFGSVEVRAGASAVVDLKKRP